MKLVKVITVCGSGTVTSAMLSSKVTDLLEERGCRVKTVEVNPNGVAAQVQSGHWDLIVHSSPLITVPDKLTAINGVPLLTGRGEAQFIAELDAFVARLK